MGAVYLAAETLTQNQIIEMWEKKHGEKLQVTYVTGKDLEEMQQAVKKDRVHNYWSQWPGFIQVSHVIVIGNEAE
jgi:DNA-binding ferritin-like protein (Dps family)